MPSGVVAEADDRKGNVDFAGLLEFERDRHCAARLKGSVTCMNIRCSPPGLSSTVAPAGISSPPSTGRMVITSLTIPLCEFRPCRRWAKWR